MTWRRFLLVSALVMFASPSSTSAQTIAPSTPGASPVNKYQLRKQDFNENTVTIVSGQTSGTYLKMAEDLQNVLDRREDNGLRILPVVGTPGPQNILDVLFLRGVDLCMTETDYFDYFRQLDPSLYGDIERKIHYIAKLYNTEFHIVARREITRLDQLRGKPVSFYTKLSSADISGRNLFKLLGIQVEAVNHDQPVATEKLRKGEIAAMLRLAGAPATAFADIKPEDGLHFVPVEEGSIGSAADGRFSRLMTTYLPARLQAEDYPNLIPPGASVPTVASSVVLAAYAWPEGSERYRRVASFVQAFFDNFDKLKEKTRHPKWSQTNLAATVPGWTRFKAARDWLEGRRSSSPAGEDKPNGASAGFEQFLSHYKASGASARGLSEAQLEALRREYRSWQSGKQGAERPRKLAP